MPTLYNRLAHIVAANPKLVELSKEQRAELGKVVAETYWATKDPKTKFYFSVFKNEEGTFRVASYPRTFTEEIDKLIKEYYRCFMPEPKPLRKRTKISKPVYSSKKI